MKNINISTEYILIYFAKLTNMNKNKLNIFTNLIHKGTLCGINYIFDQGIKGKRIFYNFTKLY